MVRAMTTDSNIGRQLAKRSWRLSPRRAAGRLLATVRVLSVLFLIQCSLSLWLLDRAYAKGAEVLRSVMEQLLAGQPAQLRAGHTLMLNGARFDTASATTPLSPEQVLDALQQRCGERGGLLGPEEVFRQLAAANPPETEGGGVALRAARNGVLRYETDAGGALLCLDSGGPLTPSGLLDRLQRFVDSGDLSSIGDARYIRAEPGDNGQTVVLASWTTGALNLARMFPTVGDAPGFDLADVPRPAAARRLLSSYAEGGAPQLASYESPLNPKQTRRAYARALRAEGWKLLSPTDPPNPVGARDKTAAPLRAAKAERTITALFAESGDGQTVTAISRL